MVLDWMRRNLAEGSIFPDCQSRIMTSDQVMVFRTGNMIDKSILFCAIVANHGNEARIEVIEGQVNVRIDDLLINLHESI